MLTCVFFELCTSPDLSKTRPFNMVRTKGGTYVLSQG